MGEQDYANVGRWLCAVVDAGVVVTVMHDRGVYRALSPHYKQVVGSGSSVGQAVQGLLVGLRDRGVIDG